MRRRNLTVLASVAALALVATGCAADDDGRPASLRLFAAASLTEAFTELGETFQAEHPHVDVIFNFAASSALAQQITEGSPADLFASADEASMRRLTESGHASDPRVIARNRLAILVEKGNPKGIAGLSDLAGPDVVLVLCAPAVPCGKLASAALAEAGVTAQPSSLEENVKAVVSKITFGEADAGIVYATDVKAAGDAAEGVDIDIARDPDLEAVYPIALTTASRNRGAAQAWVDFVLSGDGQRVLAIFGFDPP